ncbi:MAG: HD-GYP domain-containing protein [Gammaproteobacteria bacterium]|nr:HD-GYP domain-containing protein [Gammaproteobacteria bacterium]
MLKKIQVSQLRLGMFVNEFCGSWMEHPFWTTKFLLKNPKDLARIGESGITELWIDTDKGADLAADQAGQGVAQAEAERRIEAALADAVKAPAEIPQRVSLEVEVQRAAKICAKAKEAVASMFQEARMGKTAQAEQFLPMVEEISASVLRNPGALISLARLKNQDEYTYMHSVAVCALMVALARQLGMNEEDTREAGIAGLLHDLGKAMIPLEILNKPGKLTDAEFQTVKSHPQEGFKLLVDSDQVSAIPLDVVLHHHEKVDGSGYPHRLAGEQITLFAKMGAVCDVYDAITSNRPYKAGWDPGESLRKMTEWAAGHFDDRVFKAFVKSVGIYPVGSLVRLESGRLAVVMEQSEKSLLVPIVKVFYSTKAKRHLMHELLDLSKPSAQDKIVSWESPERWGIANMNEIWGCVVP